MVAVSKRNIVLILISLGVLASAVYSYKLLRDERRTHHLLSLEFKSLAKSHTELSTNNDALRDEVESLGNQHQQFEAKIQNLSAQNDSLKRAVDESQMQSYQANTELESAKLLITKLRQDLLEAHRTKPIDPDLVLQLEQKLERYQQTEERYLSQLSMHPQSLGYRLVSDDKKWIALESEEQNWSINGFERAIICRKENPIALITLRSQESNIILAEIEDWWESASTLVKGEKLFIFAFN